MTGLGPVFVSCAIGPNDLRERRSSGVASAIALIATPKLPTRPLIRIASGQLQIFPVVPCTPLRRASMGH
jgi:hypothetical protein